MDFRNIVDSAFGWPLAEERLQLLAKTRGPAGRAIRRALRRTRWGGCMPLLPAREYATATP